MIDTWTIKVSGKASVPHAQPLTLGDSCVTRLVGHVCPARTPFVSESNLVQLGGSDRSQQYLVLGRHMWRRCLVAHLQAHDQKHNNQRVSGRFSRKLVLISESANRSNLFFSNTSLYFSILTRLYRFTGDTRYYEYAMNTLNWWLGWAYDPENGSVYDTITGPECGRTGEGWWTYNSGAFLFGMADLFYVTQDDKILNLARSIAYAGMRDFSNPSTGVLVESCEDDPPPEDGKPPGCQQDETLVSWPCPWILPCRAHELIILSFQFKGIFMLGLSELYLARPDENIYNFINTQMLSNVFNNVDPSWLFGMWWQGPVSCLCAAWP